MIDSASRLFGPWIIESNGLDLSTTYVLAPSRFSKNLEAYCIKYLIFEGH